MERLSTIVDSNTSGHAVWYDDLGGLVTLLVVCAFYWTVYRVVTGRWS